MRIASLSRIAGCPMSAALHERVTPTSAEGHSAMPYAQSARNGHAVACVRPMCRTIAAHSLGLPELQPQLSGGQMLRPRYAGGGSSAYQSFTVSAHFSMCGVVVWYWNASWFAYTS